MCLSDAHSLEQCCSLFLFNISAKMLDPCWFVRDKNGSARAKIMILTFRTSFLCLNSKNLCEMRKSMTKSVYHQYILLTMSLIYSKITKRRSGKFPTLKTRTKCVFRGNYQNTRYICHWQHFTSVSSLNRTQPICIVIQYLRNFLGFERKVFDSVRSRNVEKSRKFAPYGGR